MTAVVSIDEPLSWRQIAYGRVKQPDGSWAIFEYTTDDQRKAAFRRLFPDAPIKG